MPQPQLSSHLLDDGWFGWIDVADKVALIANARGLRDRPRIPLLLFLLLGEPAQGETNVLKVW